MASRETFHERTSEVLESAEDRIGAFADKAYEKGRAKAESAVDHQKNAFKQFCQTVVRALRSGGDELRNDGYGTVAGLVDDVAHRAEDLTEEIDDFDPRTVTEHVEDFVRERPMIAYGALALAGFLVANTLQSAAHHRHQRKLEEDLDDDGVNERPSTPKRPRTKKPE